MREVDVRAQRWRNWAGTFSVAPESVRTPATTDEVAEAVVDAERTGRTVRMVGSGHSFTGAAVARDVQLLPHGLRAVRAADPASGRVTVEAGLDLGTLCEELAARGLGLSNMGDIRAQTVSGALQTGTHGTGLRRGGFAAQVVALELVLPGGQVRTVSADVDPDLFDAARVGLGAFGIVTAVTLQTEPAYLLHAREEPRDLDEVLEGFEGWCEEHDHVEFFWFPHTRRAQLKRNDRTDGPRAPLPRWRERLDDEWLANDVFGLANRLGRARPAAIRPVATLSSRVLSPREYVDDSWRVFTSPRRVRFVEQEYAVPFDALVDAVREVVALVERSPWRISFPVEVRAAPADDAWLSTAYGRRSGYVAVHCFEGTPYRDYFGAVEAVLVGHGGRPHWGKLHSRTAADLAGAYPRFADARAVRDRVDPQRVLANPYVTRVLGA